MSAKHAPDATLDAALDYIGGSNVMHALSAYTPGDSYATVVGNSLADVAMAGGDFTVADGDAGDGNGRKNTVGAKNDVEVDANGDADHVALVNSGDSSVRYVTTCATQALTSGNTVNFPSWKVQIADPT